MVALRSVLGIAYIKSTSLILTCDVVQLCDASSGGDRGGVSGYGHPMGRIRDHCPSTPGDPPVPPQQIPSFDLLR